MGALAVTTAGRSRPISTGFDPVGGHESGFVAYSERREPRGTVRLVACVLVATASNDNAGRGITPDPGEE